MIKRLLLNGLWTSLIVALCGLVMVSANAVAGDYHECVGYYQMQLPGSVDIATTTPLIYEENIIRNPDRHISHPIQFSNGEVTMYSSFVFDGEFEIIRGISDEWAHDFLERRRHNITSSRKMPDGDNEFVEIPANQSDAFFYSGRVSAGFNLYKHGKMITYRLKSYNDKPAALKERILDTFAGLHIRQPYEIPLGRGACLPGIFVADNGKDTTRTVGVTFRLNSHPDVTIFFLDSSAGDLSKMSSRQKNEFVWTSDAVGKVIDLHGPLKYRPTMMAGRYGTASFATVTRYDGATDYAYLVTVQGDPDASVDTPDLELLVQRTAKYAAKDVPPVTGDELEEIAKAVAASVKRRSVQ